MSCLSTDTQMINLEKVKSTHKEKNSVENSENLKKFVDSKPVIDAMKMNKMKKLIYVMDPHCGWCYGNSKNIETVAEQFKDKLNIQLMVGGMWLEGNAPNGGEEFSRFIAKHSPQMEATTGAFVSSIFFELTKDSTYTFSSLEPCCAINLVKELKPNMAITFAKEVQKAIFAEGKRLDNIETYLPIIKGLNINAKQFQLRWMKDDNLSKTKEEFDYTKQLVNGFPTLLLYDENQIQIIASGYFNTKQIIEKIKNLTTIKN
ncbi:DsbA family protein [Flavivirga aquatica]|nr:DsbA family protein [Flavivirga aquatica]